MITDTTYSQEAGRWSGIWNILRHTPYLSDQYSIVLLLTAPIGVFFLYAWAKTIGRWNGILFIVIVLSFIVSHCASLNAWQRYYDPFIFIMLGLLSSLKMASDNYAIHPLSLAGVALACVLQLILTGLKLGIW